MTNVLPFLRLGGSGGGSGVPSGPKVRFRRYSARFGPLDAAMTSSDRGLTLAPARSLLEPPDPCSDRGRTLAPARSLLDSSDPALVGSGGAARLGGLARSVGSPSASSAGVRSCGSVSTGLNRSPARANRSHTERIVQSRGPSP